LTFTSPLIATNQRRCAFLKKVVRHHGLPDKVTIDKSGANTAALETLQEETDHPIERRQIKYLNTGVEQDHHANKRLTRPMLRFNAFRSARITLQGIELIHMIKKGQRVSADGRDLSAAEKFCSLAS
jgi:transposase-like protein